MYMLHVVIYSLCFRCICLMLHAVILFLNLSLLYIRLSKYKPYRVYAVLLHNIRRKIKFLGLGLYLKLGYIFFTVLKLGYFASTKQKPVSYLSNCSVF